MNEELEEEKATRSRRVVELLRIIEQAGDELVLWLLWIQWIHCSLSRGHPCLCFVAAFLQVFLCGRRSSSIVSSRDRAYRQRR